MLPTHRAAPALSDREVHVWTAVLSLMAPYQAELNGLLSPDERARAERFRFTDDAGRYVMSRGLLRVLLSRYLDTPPETMIFHSNRWGKPALAEPGASSLLFNLSHSGDKALIALSRTREVGVDIERVRPDLAVEALAARYFSTSEAAALTALPESERRQAFFQLWARKEAYLKGCGTGISGGLGRFSFAYDRAGGHWSVQSSDDPRAANWSVRDVPAGDDYTAAVAAEREWTLTMRLWPAVAG